MLKKLVIFYSRRGQNYVNGGIKNLKKGNAELLAEYIVKAIGADSFEVDTVKPYSADYMVCTEEAKRELEQQARPELKKYLDSIADYDSIILVGPNWSGSYPMAIYTQLERLDFTGKKVHFVVTHEGSGLGIVESTLRKSCKGADIGEGLAVQGGGVQNAEGQVAEWAKSLM